MPAEFHRALIPVLYEKEFAAEHTYVKKEATAAIKNFESNCRCEAAIATLGELCVSKNPAVAEKAAGSLLAIIKNLKENPLRGEPLGALMKTLGPLLEGKRSVLKNNAQKIFKEFKSTTGNEFDGLVKKSLSGKEQEWVNEFINCPESESK
jgi:hypothetical protein